MGPRPGLIHPNSDPVQESPTMYFVVENNPVRCFLACALSGGHAMSVIKEEFSDFAAINARVMRLQRGMSEPIGVIDVYELAEKNMPRNQVTG
jgi:hypothetical protein